MSSPGRVADRSPPDPAATVHDRAVGAAVVGVLLALVVAGGALGAVAMAAAAGTASPPSAPAAGGVPSGPFTTVAVGPNETVEGRVDANGGRVVIAGTIRGDLRAYGGVVVLTEGAVVTGDVQAFGGRVVIAGTVRGPVTAYGGTVLVTGRTGALNAGGTTVRLAGTTREATVLGGRVVLAAPARVEGDLEYDARLVRRGGVVVGEVRATDALLGPVGDLLRLAGWLPVLAPLLAAALGAGLARATPRTDALAARARARPARSLVCGLLLVPVAAVLPVALVVSLVGLPLLGVALPAFGAAALLALAVGERAVGGALAARLPVSTTAATAGVAALAALPGVGPPVALALLSTGAGALATLKPARRRLPTWT